MTIVSSFESNESLHFIEKYWALVNRKVFENGRPKNIPKLKERLIEVFEDINLNHKDLIKKSHANFVVIVFWFLLLPLANCRKKKYKDIFNNNFKKVQKIFSQMLKKTN